MAYGLLCINCGWQETEHVMVWSKELKEKAKIVLNNFKISLADCEGFTYSPEDLIIAKEEEKKRIAEKPRISFWQVPKDIDNI